MDVNELYNVALGMYDFDLVLFVAERSQKVRYNRNAVYELCCESRCHSVTIDTLNYVV